MKNSFFKRYIKCDDCNKNILHHEYKTHKTEVKTEVILLKSKHKPCDTDLRLNFISLKDL